MLPSGLRVAVAERLVGFEDIRNHGKHDLAIQGRETASQTLAVSLFAAGVLSCYGSASNNTKAANAGAALDEEGS